MSQVIRECEKKSLDYFILHTGQHYSYNLDQIFVTGNTVVDAVYQNLSISKDRINTMNELVPEEYFLATAHRRENVDI